MRCLNRRRAADAALGAPHNDVTVPRTVSSPNILEIFTIVFSTHTTTSCARTDTRQRGTGSGSVGLVWGRLGVATDLGGAWVGDGGTVTTGSASQGHRKRRARRTAAGQRDRSEGDQQLHLGRIGRPTHTMAPCFCVDQPGISAYAASLVFGANKIRNQQPCAATHFLAVAQVYIFSINKSSEPNVPA